MFRAARIVGSLLGSAADQLNPARGNDRNEDRSTDQDENRNGNHLSDGRFGRNAALDQPRRCRCLHHDVLAHPTSVFGRPDHQNPELGRNDVEPFGAVFANHMQRPTAAWAAVILDIDHRLDPRQATWQRATIGLALGGSRLPLGRRCGFLAGLIAGRGLLDLFKAQQQSVFGERLSPPAEPMTLHLFDDPGEPLGASALGQQVMAECAKSIQRLSI